MLNFLKKEKGFIKIPKFVYILAFVLLILVAVNIAGQKYYKNIAKRNIEESEEKKVETMIVDQDAKKTELIKTIGTVKAGSKVDIVALTGGTIANVYYDIGDEVSKNTFLGNITNRTTSINYNNALLGFNNSSMNLESTKRSIQETLKQAEIGVKNAKQTLDSAKIAFETAENNYNNSKELQESGNKNTKKTAIIAFDGYLNTIHSALDSINYIIKAEGERQIDGISGTLAIKNSQSLIDAKNSYFKAKEIKDELDIIVPTEENIKESLEKILDGLSKTRKATNNTIVVLDNTISSSDFSETTLNTQKSSFNTMLSTIVSSESNAQSTLNSLQNLDTTNEKELDNLFNALKSSEAQYKNADLAYQSALASLENTKQTANQQLISSKMSYDSANSQLGIAKEQLDYLNIKTPIGGTVSGKYIEIGTEVSPGQKLFEVSQTTLVKVEINLSPKDIAKIKTGQRVVIDNELEGVVTKISPTADPISRKIKVEIAYDNKNGELIPETFVDIEVIADEVTLNHGSIFNIPLKAVNVTQNESYVFLLGEKGIAQKTIVEVGSPNGQYIEITKGLEDGDELITKGNKNLEGGEKVKKINE